MRATVDNNLFAELVELRRELHRHPELSWQEERTGQRVRAFLDRIGLDSVRTLVGTGFVIDIPGVVDGPAVALRADMDALPIVEETGLAFASINEGCMHACGHDAHMAMVLGAAALLARETPPAPVRLIFQPAEELGQGALAMMEAGALDGVCMIFGGHVDRHFPTGTIAVTEGVVNASTDSFRILVRGRGAHGARPHEGVDAVVVGTLIVSALQTIVSREVNPAHPSVVTVGRFAAGTACNVIAAEAVLEGTVRAQDSEVREHLISSVRHIAESAGRLHGAHVSFEIMASTPAVDNVQPMTDLARRAAIEVVGQADVRKMDVANMGAEDFAYYLARVPGCYVRFGSCVPGREGYPAHSSRFDVDERVLAVGAAFFHAVAHVAGIRIASDIDDAESAA